MTWLLLSAVLYSLASAGLAALVRKLPWPAHIAQRKPIGCVVCMAGWAAIVVLVFAYAGELLPKDDAAEVILLWLAATGGATYLLTQSGVFADWDQTALLTEREDAHHPKAPVPPTPPTTRLG